MRDQGLAIRVKKPVETSVATVEKNTSRARASTIQERDVSEHDCAPLPSLSNDSDNATASEHSGTLIAPSGNNPTSNRGSIAYRLPLNVEAKAPIIPLLVQTYLEEYDPYRDGFLMTGVSTHHEESSTASRL